MTVVNLTWQSDNTLLVSGELSFASVEALLKQATAIIANKDQIVIDLCEVSRSDSAGLALLIEWSNMAQKKQIPLRFINPPAQIVRMATISGVNEFLEFNRDES